MEGPCTGSKELFYLCVGKSIKQKKGNQPSDWSGGKEGDMILHRKKNYLKQSLETRTERGQGKKGGT